MPNRKIIKTGHSAAVTLPSQMLKKLDLAIGDSVKVELEQDRGIISIKQAQQDLQLPLNLKIRPKL